LREQALAGGEIIIDFRMTDLLAIFPCQNKDFEEAEWKLVEETTMIQASCHLDRERRSVATEGEWRDPEAASSAMSIRGVPPMLSIEVRVTRLEIIKNPL